MARSDEFSAGQEKPSSLSDEDKKVLDFAGRTYQHEGKKWADVSEEFGGWDLTRYNQKLARLLNNPDAVAYAPETIAKHQKVVDDWKAMHRRGTNG